MKNHHILLSLGASTLVLLAGCGGSRVSTSLSGEQASLDVVGTDSRQIGPYQNAVRNECWYALNKDFLGQSNSTTGPSNSMSNWAYIGPDADAGSNAIKHVLNTYQYAVSDRWPETGQIPANKFNQCVADLINTDYSLNFKGVRAGHGCQCVSFATMILFRAVNYRLAWSYKSVNPSSYSSWTKAQVGDIVFRKDNDHSGHLAIVVGLDGSRGLTVVDSNWDYKETIQRHYMSASQLSPFHTLSGAGKWR